MTDESSEGTRSGHAPKASINIDAALKARLVEIAAHAGVDVDEFVERILRRLAEAEVHFERGVPVFPRRPGARVCRASSRCRACCRCHGSRPDDSRAERETDDALKARVQSPQQIRLLLERQDARAQPCHARA
jgi:hypothetical protein